MKYDEDYDLPDCLEQSDYEIERVDFQVKVGKDESVSCSIYKRNDRELKNLIIYIHSFSGNRLEGTTLIDDFGKDFAILVYDQRGCGNNLSEFVTLGLRESEDLFQVMKYVKEHHSY